MNIHRCVVVVLGIFATGATLVFAQSPDPAVIVDQFYPQKYVDDAAREGEQLIRKSCYAVYQSLPNGAPQLIVAGYSDGFQGTVRILSQQSPGLYSVAYEPSNLFLGGNGCKVELVDIDGDGAPEIHIAFGSFRGGDGDWIFKWNGSQLTSLGPMSVRKGVSDTKLANVVFLDLYHNGTKQVLSVGGTPPPPDGSAPDPISILYRLVDGRFVVDTPVAFTEEYSSLADAAQPETSFFYLAKGSKGPYTLLVVNGDSNGVGRVRSGTITVNGARVIASSQFTQQVERLSVSLAGLLPENTVTVQLDGNAGSHIAVMIKDETPAFLNQ